MESRERLTITDLPREDVLCRHILPYLGLGDLFSLRASCFDLHQTVRGYFTVLVKLELSQVGSSFSADSMSLIVAESFMLKILHLSAAKKWLQNEHLIPIIKNNAGLERLNICGCSCLNNGVLHCLSTWSPELREICLGDCHWVSNQGLLTLIEHCRFVEVLDLSGCWELQDVTLVRLAHLAPRLYSINLSGVYSITDNTIMALARCCQQLRTVYLQSCWRVTDDGIRYLGEYSKKLRLLHVKDCRSITEASMARIRLKGVIVDIPSKNYELTPSYTRYLNNLKLQI